MVLVNSICTDTTGGELLVWVTISHGTTQWARWQANTGDPNIIGNVPEPPEPDRSYTRSDLGVSQKAEPEGLLRDGINGLESWQKDIPFKRHINKDKREWAMLPCDQDAGAYNKPWLYQFAMETLRHENLHNPYDGAMPFEAFYKHMTKKGMGSQP